MRWAKAHAVIAVLKYIYTGIQVFNPAHLEEIYRVARTLGCQSLISSLLHLCEKNQLKIEMATKLEPAAGGEEPVITYEEVPVTQEMTKILVQTGERAEQNVQRVSVIRMGPTTRTNHDANTHTNEVMQTLPKKRPCDILAAPPNVKVSRPNQVIDLTNTNDAYTIGLDVPPKLCPKAQRVAKVPPFRAFPCPHCHHSYPTVPSLKNHIAKDHHNFMPNLR